MAAFQVNVNGLPRPVDGNGNVYPSGTLSFYQAGATSTTINVYAEQALSTNLGPTITASGDGLFVDMWVNEDYRVVLKNAAGVIQWTRDVYSPLGSGTVDTTQLAAGAAICSALHERSARDRGRLGRFSFPDNTGKRTLRHRSTARSV